MKPTRQFIICLIAFLSFSLSSFTCYANQPIDLPFHRTDTSTSGGQRRAPFRVPLTASYTADVLSFNFLYPTGSATITITDDFGAVVYLVTIDTSIQPDLYIPVDQWDGGSYYITIEYGCNTFTAEFAL
jgi:hypothetical protein